MKKERKGGRGRKEERINEQMRGRKMFENNYTLKSDFFFEKKNKIKVGQANDRLYQIRLAVSQFSKFFFWYFYSDIKFHYCSLFSSQAGSFISLTATS